MSGTLDIQSSSFSNYLVSFIVAIPCYPILSKSTRGNKFKAKCRPAALLARTHAEVQTIPSPFSPLPCLWSVLGLGNGIRSGTLPTPRAINLIILLTQAKHKIRGRISQSRFFHRISNALLASASSNHCNTFNFSIYPSLPKTSKVSQNSIQVSHLQSSLPLIIHASRLIAPNAS